MGLATAAVAASLMSACSAPDSRPAPPVVEYRTMSDEAWEARKAQEKHIRDAELDAILAQNQIEAARVEQEIAATRRLHGSADQAQAQCQYEVAASPASYQGGWLYQAAMSNHLFGMCMRAKGFPQ